MKKTNSNQKLIGGIAIILVAVILAIVITTNVINSNVGSEEYSATTANVNSNLVASYIKEGITIGGITGTLEVLDTSDADATPEDIMWGETAYVKGEKIIGTMVDIKIGQYVNYTPDTAGDYNLSSSISGYSSNETITQEKNLKWKILSINNDGTVDLISATPTSKGFKFLGALGYNNAVYVLNDICKKQYSNVSLDAVARSINQEDIESKMNATGKNMIKDYENIGSKYGDIFTNKNVGEKYYPSLYAKENGSGINTTTVKKDGINQSDSYYTSPTTETYLEAGSNGLTTTQTNYAIGDTDTKKCFDDSLFYNLIFGNGEGWNYWLATRSVSHSVNDNYFLIKRVTEGSNINGCAIFRSNLGATANYTPTCLRIIVTLSDKVVIYGGDGSEEHPYELKIQ